LRFDYFIQGHQDRRATQTWSGIHHQLMFALQHKALCRRTRPGLAVNHWRAGTLKNNFHKQLVQGRKMLAHIDAWVVEMPVAPKARYVCQDADDQKFIDLAVAHQTLLLSKDKAVLTMAKRLRALGVQTAAKFSLLGLPT
jgi:hypothetical protein